MTSETTKVKAKLKTLTASLDELEETLEPLFAQSLPETIVGLEPIQQAKLQTVLPYLVYDLIFVYLKSKGIDPKTHPVIPELDRVRQHFQKIANAEKPAPSRGVEIDKAAASRFIKHAIAQATWVRTPAEEEETPEASTSKERVPVKITSKMEERAQYQKELKEVDAQESDHELQVFEGAEETGNSMDVDTNTTTLPNSKRKRPAIDPFAGFGDEPSVLEIKQTILKKSRPEESLQLSTSSETARVPSMNLPAHTGPNAPAKTSPLKHDEDASATEISRKVKTKKLKKKAKNP